jgi:hypothetical protein
LLDASVSVSGLIYAILLLTIAVGWDLVVKFVVWLFLSGEEYVREILTRNRPI